MAKPRVKVDDRVWQELKSRLKALGKGRVKVGVLASQGGNAEHSNGLTIIELAAIHEFGSPAAHIPERSFLRRTMRERMEEIYKFQTKLAKAIINRKMGVPQALGLLGTAVASWVKFTIQGGPHIPPPLKPATIERKGSDRPLLDTGRLVGAITYEVDNG
jgi:phage gpG-like protein